MQISKITSKANFYTTLLIVAGIIMVVNIIFSFFSFKIDLTKNKIFSTSPVTKKILKNLDDVITVKAYFTKNLPGYFVDVREGAKDILKEYQALSGGKIKIKFIDPVENDDLKQEAMRLGIPPVQLNTIKNDKREAIQAFLGIAIFYQDKEEVIPVVQNIGSLEYDLTSIIKKITLTETPQIALVEDYGSLKSEEELQTINRELTKQYDLEKLELKNEQEFNQIKTVILPGLKEKIEDKSLEILKNLIQQGKALIILQEQVSVDNGLKTEILETGIEKILLNLGIQLNKDLIVDAERNSEASFSSGFFTFLTPYIYWPRITEQGFNRESGIVNKLQNVTFPWTSSIKINEKQGYKVDILAKTSKNSALVENTFNLDPQSQPKTIEGSQGEHIIAAHLYNDKEKEGNKINLILVSDSDFITDNFISRFPENLTFFQNLVDSVSLDQDLISIRSKGEVDRPLKEISIGARTTIKYLNIFGVSVLFCGIGLFRFLVRRKVGVV